MIKDSQHPQAPLHSDTHSTPTKKPLPNEDAPTPTPPASRLLHHDAPPNHSKHTGCNCSKSQCLKMYCVCFAMGRVCESVRLVLSRVAFAETAKISQITWIAAKPSMSLSPGILTLSAGKWMLGACWRHPVTVGSPTVLKNTATASSMGNSVRLSAAVSSAETASRIDRRWVPWSGGLPRW